MNAHTRPVLHRTSSERTHAASKTYMLALKSYFTNSTWAFASQSCSRIQHTCGVFRKIWFISTWKAVHMKANSARVLHSGSLLEVTGKCYKTYILRCVTLDMLVTGKLHDALLIRLIYHNDKVPCQVYLRHCTTGLRVIEQVECTHDKYCVMLLTLGACNI
jgi:hypothetical protein